MDLTNSLFGQLVYETPLQGAFAFKLVNAFPGSVEHFEICFTG